MLTDEFRRLVRHFGEWVERDPKGMFEEIEARQKKAEYVRNRLRDIDIQLEAIHRATGIHLGDRNDHDS